MDGAPAGRRPPAAGLALLRLWAVVGLYSWISLTSHLPQHSLQSTQGYPGLGQGCRRSDAAAPRERPRRSHFRGVARSAHDCRVAVRGDGHGGALPRKSDRACTHQFRSLLRELGQGRVRPYQRGQNRYRNPEALRGRCWSGSRRRGRDLPIIAAAMIDARRLSRVFELAGLAEAEVMTVRADLLILIKRRVLKY